MRAYEGLLVIMLCCVARTATAQLTGRDSAALVDGIAERIRMELGTGVKRAPFVIIERDTLAEAVRFAMRVTAAIQARDSSLIATEPLQSTKRVQIGRLEFVRPDTVAVRLWVGWCEGTLPRYNAHDVPLAFRRVGNRWLYVQRNVGGSGAGASGCPW